MVMIVIVNKCYVRGWYWVDGVDVVVRCGAVLVMMMVMNGDQSDCAVVAVVVAATNI